MTLPQERLEFLARMPVLLTSSLDVRAIVSGLLRHLDGALDAEASSIFLVDGRSGQLIFWSLEGSEKDRLQGTRIAGGTGIVGWVTTNRKSVVVNDAANDPRFFSGVDADSGFKTRSVVCTPLLTRGDAVLGALEVLNKRENGSFDEADAYFLEQVGAQVALAIENAHLFEEARARTHQLAVLDRRKQDMLTVLTHELRTPLNVIRNAAEMILDDSLPKASRDRIGETLERGVTRLSNLVSRLKTMSAVTDESLSLTPSAISVETFLREIITQFEELQPPRELSITISVPSALPNIRGDWSLLSVAVRNLIANAIRFTPDGGSIVVGARPHAALVEIFVEDTGIGIEKAQIPLIFEKFYEVGDANQHSSGSYEFRSGGLGLGLAAVRSILSAHGSSVDVQSTPGSGSRFSFCVPSVRDDGAREPRD